MDLQVISNFKKLYTKALFERCFEGTEGINFTLREFWKYHVHIVTCLKSIENAWEGVTKRTLTSAWKKFWTKIVVEYDFEESETAPEEAVVNEIVSLAKFMELEVDKNDIHELVEDTTADYRRVCGVAVCFTGRICEGEFVRGAGEDSFIKPLSSVHALFIKENTLSTGADVPGREIIPIEQYLAVLEEVSKERQAENESDSLNLIGEVTEYRDRETNSETDLEDNPVHEEYSDSDSNTNVCIAHPFYF
ncbi:hypothetical protein AVEN_230246-1 [Araneus ventricosus]|uniref:DDE-1 domain-containing protein n=1 Tax=Araneus ventricosus TaxID=182803 RepID=A0A4Y2DUV2_ARAVE|nr:hypothetical protein AVEN_230246-1 [Araneus ventricosus]